MCIKGPDNNSILAMRRGNLWEGVEFTLDRGKKPFKCSLSGVGMFLCIQMDGKQRPMYLFIPDFKVSVVTGSIWCVRIQCVSRFEIWYFAEFEDEEKMTKFVEFANDKISVMNKTVSAATFQESFTINVEGLSSKSQHPHKYELTVDPGLGEVRIERHGFQKKFPMTEILCSSLVKQYKSFKKSAATDLSFEIFEASSGIEWVFVCEAEHDMMRTVMMTYIHSFRRIIAKRSEEVESHQEEPEVKSFEIGIESIYPTQQPILSESLNTKLNDACSDDEKETRSTFLPPEKCVVGRRKEKFEELARSLDSLYNPVPLELPSVRSLRVNSVSKVQYTNDSASGIINEAKSCLPVGDFGGVFTNFDNRTIRELVEDAEKSVVGPPCVDLSTLIDIRAFPEFPLQQYKNASEPSMQFLDVLKQANTQLLETSKPITDDSSLGRTVALLCIAFMTNGMPDKAKFISVYSYFSKSVECVESALVSAKRYTVPWEQMSVFVVSLLNTGSILPLLRTMQRSESWTRDNFLLTSIVNCESAFSKALKAIEDGLLKARFSMCLTPDIVTHGDEMLIHRFIQTPAMGHLGIRRCIKRSPFVPDMTTLPRFLFRLLSSDVHADYLDGELSSPGKTAFLFIKDLVTNCFVHRNQDWSEMASIVKSISPSLMDFKLSLSHVLTIVDNVAKDNGLSMWIEAGLVRRKIHIWILFLGTSPSLAKRYFSPDSVIRDMFRLKYVVNYLAELMRNLS